nr:immunoglobulin heavy chain junction region [Mus musculus]
CAREVYYGNYFDYW